MEWTNDVIIEFLDLYEAEPPIWNRQNELHKDRHQVYDAWKRIQAQISVKCSLKDLKRKKENLMATFRKLSGKVKKSAETGSGTYEVYKPEWFAYDKMASFLQPFYTARRTATTEGPKNVAAPDEDNEDEAFDTVNDIDDSSIARNGSNDNNREVTEHLEVPKGGPSVKKRKKSEKMVSIEQRMDEAYNYLKEVATKPKIKKGEIQLFCDLLCTRLESLEEHKRDFIMHKINNFMFNVKNPSHLSNAMPNQHFYQQPQNCTNFPQFTPNQYQPSAVRYRVAQGSKFDDEKSDSHSPNR